MRKIFIVLILTGVFSMASAKDMPGYIIRTSGDTVKGMVDVISATKFINGEKQNVFPEMWTSIKFFKWPIHGTGTFNWQGKDL